MSLPNHITVTVLLICLIFNKIGAQEFYSTEYTVQQGIPQEYIYTISQDSSGYLWVGTGNGLAKYDGFTFQTFTTADSLADNFITTSHAVKGKVWFGHMSGDISVYENDKFNKYVFPVEDKTAITSICSSPNNEVWASTFASGLVLLGNKGKGTVYQVKERDFYIASFAFISEQDLLIGSTDGLYHARINSTREIELVYHYREIPKSKIQTIIKQKNAEGFYIASQNSGIYLLDFKGKNPSVKRIDSRLPVRVENVQQILEDSRQNLWICTFGNGIIKTKLGKKGELEETTDVTEQVFQNLKNSKFVFEDREENLWVGNYGENLVRLKYRAYYNQSFENSEYGSKVLSVYSIGSTRWVGTDKGLLRYKEGLYEPVDFYSQPEGLPDDGITALYTAHNDEVWVGTSQNGVYRLQVGTGKVERHMYSVGQLENSVTSITGAGRRIWIGTKKGVYEIVPGTKNKKWYTIQTKGLPHNTISHLFYDSNSRLWIVTPSSVLAYLEAGKIKKINLATEERATLLHSVTEDKNGNVWAGSQGSGVFLIHSDSILNLTTSEGLFSNFCYSMLCDVEGNLWVGHHNGLSRVHTNTLLVKSITSFNSEGINFDFSENASLSDNNGHLWFGTSKGLFNYIPERESLKTPPPILNIAAVKVDDKMVEVEDKIVLPPGRYKLQVEFVGISLKEPEMVKYQHILEGYDDDWSEISHRRTVVYPQLINGKYVLKINASSGDGTATYQPKQLTVIIQVPIWKRWWFYVISIIIVVALVFFYIKRREYKLQAEKRLLEQKVSERTKEIERQKNEIIEQRDLINRKNIDITDSIKYASRIQSAIMPSDKLLNELLPHNFIINKPRDIVSGDFIWFTEKKEKVVLAVTDCTGHGVPGAIMSMLGISSLNEIVNNQGIVKPNLILDELRKKVISSLNPENLDNPTYDGMSLSLCVIDFKNNKFEFSGANNNMLYVSHMKQEILTADRIPIGVWYMDQEKYSGQTVEYSDGDVIYMFTDGYQDQFGGKNDKKFSSRRLREMLFTIHRLPFADQKRILEETLNEWINGDEQTDDITLMGVRL